MTSVFFCSLALIAAGIGCKSADSPLKKIAEVPLPGSTTRFDYQSIDESTGRLYLSHMGDGKLIVFDTNSEKVVADLPGYPTVTGVLAVPEEGKVYASAAGGHEVVVTDMKTLKVLARIKGADFPDGIAYAAPERKVFVSDESGGIDLVIDCKSDKSLGKIALGGEAGNTHYDPVGDRIWVAVQTKNEMLSIDPQSQKVVGRFRLDDGEHPHGFTIDAPNHAAYISCQDNNKLLVADLTTMKVRQSFKVERGPDVLAFDQGLQRLYVGCEGGAIDVFQADKGGLKPIGEFRAPNAHSVSVSQKTHRVFVPLKNMGGRPMLWILEPVRSAR